MFNYSPKNIVSELVIPQSSVGAPCPIVMSDEHNLYVAYYMQEDSEDFSEEEIGLVIFTNFHLYQFGAPNDESFLGHPLYKNGLRPYSCFEIKDSSWCKEYEKRNSVHPHHSKEKFLSLKHLVWSFHDTTMEVLCKSFSFEQTKGSPVEVIAQRISLMK